MDIKIRKLEVKDYDKIWCIYSEVFERTDRMRRYYSIEEYIAFFERQGYAYVAELDDVCGVILAYDTPELFCGVSLYIDLVAVKRNYQKKGIGGALIHYIEEVAKQKGITEISIRTACYMDSYQIYKKLGFCDNRSDLRYMIKSLRKLCD